MSKGRNVEQKKRNLSNKLHASPLSSRMRSIAPEAIMYQKGVLSSVYARSVQICNRFLLKLTILELDSCGSAGAAAGVTVSGARHLRQNLAVGRLPAPQVGHAVSSGAPHSSQKAASDRFSVWHFGHFIGISPGAERTVSTALADDSSARRPLPPFAADGAMFS